jgi:hypothetical protein
VSTRGCRKFGYDDQPDYNETTEEVDPVWVQASVVSRAERLQRQQQRQQTISDGNDHDAVLLQEPSPEELAAMIERGTVGRGMRRCCCY